MASPVQFEPASGRVHTASADTSEVDLAQIDAHGRDECVHQRAHKAPVVEACGEVAPPLGIAAGLPRREARVEAPVHDVAVVCVRAGDARRGAAVGGGGTRPRVRFPRRPSSQRARHVPCGECCVGAWARAGVDARAALTWPRVGRCRG